MARHFQNPGFWNSGIWTKAKRNLEIISYSKTRPAFCKSIYRFQHHLALGSLLDRFHRLHHLHCGLHDQTNLIVLGIHQGSTTTNATVQASSSTASNPFWLVHAKITVSSLGSRYLASPINLNHFLIETNANVFWTLMSKNPLVDITKNSMQGSVFFEATFNWRIP